MAMLVSQLEIKADLSMRPLTQLEEKECTRPYDTPCRVCTGSAQVVLSSRTVNFASTSSGLPK